MKEKQRANIYNQWEVINEIQDMVFDVCEEMSALKAFLRSKEIIINEQEFKDFKESYKVMNKLINAEE
jgi:hypothetical protein